MSAKIFNEMEEIKKRIDEMDRRIKMVPTFEIRDKNGLLEKDDVANEERGAMYVHYNEQKILIQNELLDKEVELQDHVNWRRMIDIELFCAEVYPISQTALWFVSLYGQDDAKDLEDFLVNKRDWHDVKLAAGDEARGVPSWSGREPVPDGTKVEQFDYQPYLVHVSEAKIARLPHGVGTFKELDRKSSSISSDHFSFYYGEWDRGRRSGRGIAIDDAGVYNGRFVNGKRDGWGSLDMCNGTSITGKFGLELQHTICSEGDFENPYSEGEPLGEVDIRFSDGAIFKGNMEHGRITGHGEYHSAFGETVVGTFKDGILNGKDGYYKNYAKEEYKGRFTDGQLDGHGTYCSGPFTYEGFWKYGMRHGKGSEKRRKRYHYEGYFVNDLRTGHGVLQFGKKSVKECQAEDNRQKETQQENSLKTVEVGGDVVMRQWLRASEFKYTYQGYMLANRVAPGGLLMTSADSDTPRLAPVKNPILADLVSERLENEKRRLRLRRKTEKFMDIEAYIRSEFERKKHKVFRQQRHFTKKFIYQDDKVGGASEDASDAAKSIRQDRLDKMNVDRLFPSRALVPRLQFVDQTPNTKLDEAFSSIILVGDLTLLNTAVAKMAVSNFDEVAERERMIRFDLLWERAEKIYTDRKKVAAEHSNS